MFKTSLLFTLLAITQILHGQINVSKFDLNIETSLSDTLQNIYSTFLNNEVDKISIIELKKRYNHAEYYQFLRQKKWYQSRKKWIENNSEVGSIIREGKPYTWVSFDAIVFENRFAGVDKEFIESEVFLDSSETKLALTEMFNGTTNKIMTLCYNPRHAVLFYNNKGQITGIFEICFECANVKIGIIGTTLFAKNLPYLKSLFEKHQINANN